MTKVKVHNDTPSETIVKAANQPTTLIDANGRKIGIKKLSPLDRLRLFEVIGPENSKNEQYVGYAALAFLVTSIDGESVSRPENKIRLEALVQRLNDEGMDAIGAHLEAVAEAAKTASDDALKNG